MLLVKSVCVYKQLVELGTAQQKQSAAKKLIFNARLPSFTCSSCTQNVDDHCYLYCNISVSFFSFVSHVILHLWFLIEPLY